MAARLGQRSVPGTQLANARRATGLLQHRAVQHEDLGTRRIPHQAKRVTAPGASARCAQRWRGSQRREDHRDPRASHGPARLVRYRGDRLPSAGGRPEQMSVRAPASWDLSLTRGVESTHPCPPTRPPRGACVAVTPNLVWIAQVGDCVQVLYDRGRSCARGGGRGDGSWHATKGTRAPHGRLRVRSGQRSRDRRGDRLSHVRR